MPTITLPDGSTKVFDAPVTAYDVAMAIGPRLAQAALGCKINGELRDLSTRIDADCALAVVTDKTRDKQPDPDGLFLIRHSAAHVMAEAIQDVLGKDILLAYGPPTDTGFFYDMFVPEGKKISSDHFDAINRRIAEIIKEDRAFLKYTLPNDMGLKKLVAEGNKYKLDNAHKALAAGAQELSWYVTGKLEGVVWTPSGDENVVARLADLGNGTAIVMHDRDLRGSVGQINTQHAFVADLGNTSRVFSPGNWEDLCRGPHVPSTGRIGVAVVTSLASAYWHGDENSDRLIRVYGTAFFTQAQLDEYLRQREEAGKRDHRVIGKALRLFHIDEDVGQGLILWTPNGSIVRKELQAFIAMQLARQGYTEVFTPHIGRLELYKTSGHFPYYKDSQFAPILERQALEELSAAGCSCAEMMHRVEGVSARLAAGINERTRAQTISPERVLPDDQLVDGFMLRPMNCPHHAKIFASAPHSYRDMPVRLAEFGTVYRWEQSGELNGMTRVRGFTQDDAHLFCTEEQIPAEIQGCLSLVKTIFGVLGMKDYRVRVGLRDPDSTKYTGSKESWDKAEAACIEAAMSLGVSFSKEPGEAAFYGPKIDFVVKDVIGREWQLGTVQVDYQMGNRFDLSYIGPDNKPHRPVVIHRAPFGSMERFCGVLIEHFAGAFPAWLSPQQARVLPISEKSNDYAQAVLDALRAAGVRAGIDTGADRIQGKVKAAADEKVPYMLIVGPRDAESRTVSVRRRGTEKDLGAMPLDAFVSALKAEIEARRAELDVQPNA
ncbi:MAG: threonine--tRNA ligase [Phycisphaeraceae bacterium]|nr:threonine--tRNA ligase [Phycisphaeraceae bacterium]